MAAFAALFGALGLGLDVGVLGFLGPGGPPLPLMSFATLGFATAMSAVSFYQGSSLVLSSLQAEPLDPGDEEHRQLHNVVTEMALAAGVPKPEVYVIRDPAPNALATGRDPAHAAIALTQGALELLDREETQGVVAHEMAHIANRDTLTMTVVGVLLGSIALLADWSRRSLYFTRGRRSRQANLLLPLVLLLALLSPLLSRLLAMAISRQREYLADATGVEFSRNPLGLARALEKIGGSRSPLARASQGTAHLFICDPLHRASDEREGRVASLLSTHPPLHLRIAILRAMAHGGQPG
jgi:heat shock protein HtpX